jgi:hypothetical protein
MNAIEKHQFVADSSLEIHISQLDETWKCILQQYQHKAAESSREYGAGISCFMMLKTPKGDTNCKFYYGARDDEQEGPWKTFVLNAPNRKTFLSKYDHETTYPIAVSISITTGLIAGIKLFKFDTGEEVNLPNEDPPNSDEET